MNTQRTEGYKPPYASFVTSGKILQRVFERLQRIRTNEEKHNLKYPPNPNKKKRKLLAPCVTNSTPAKSSLQEIQSSPSTSQAQATQTQDKVSSES